MSPTDPVADAPPEVRDFVARLWSEVLNVSDVSGTDDFFALGGHSLAAMTVLNAVEQSFAVELDGIGEMWDHPTLDAFSARVAELGDRR